MSDRLLTLSSTLTPPSRVIQLRASSTLNRAQLFNAIYPSSVSQHFDTVYNMIRDNPDIFQQQDVEELNREQIRKLGAKQVLKILTTLNINMETEQHKFLASLYCLSFFNLGTSIKSMVYYLLYIKSIVTFGNNQFHRKCFQNKGFKDLGSFSLTELHHGSFSRGIGTKAVFDPKTKQFVINTNGEEGMKFWIGGLAQLCTKTILWAQLIVNGTNYGPHPFIMQVRDGKTHQVLPGLTVGDCGPKNGLNVIDNGYMMVKDVRLPLNSLLGKLGTVDENGKYTSPCKTNEQRFGLHMSPLSFGRSVLTVGSLSQAVTALTIAIRYACGRRQFKTNNDDPQQNIIIDYLTIKHRLLLPLATVMVYYFSGFKINDLYIANAKNFTDPSKKIVNQLHAVSAVLKTKASWFSNFIITQCRQTLAGHGYSSFSRLGSTYSDNDVQNTWEGDNNMLLHQTAKFLLSVIKNKGETSILDLRFVHDGVQKVQISEESLNNVGNLKVMLEGLFIVRYHQAVKEMERIKSQVQGKFSKEVLDSEIRNRLQPYFGQQLALAYGDLIYFDILFRRIENKEGSQKNRNFLSLCLRTWAQSVLLKGSVEDIECRKILQKLIIEGCEQIYPDCIVATDAITPPSYIIGSPFALQNGDGMKAYLNSIFTAKKTFGRVPWFDTIVKLRESQ